MKKQMAILLAFGLMLLLTPAAVRGTIIINEAPNGQDTITNGNDQNGNDQNGSAQGSDSENGGDQGNGNVDNGNQGGDQNGTGDNSGGDNSGGGAAVNVAGAAAGAAIDFSNFFTELQPYGSFVKNEECGCYEFCPKVSEGWRPYTEGCWQFTSDYGCCWQANNPCMNICDHYGYWHYRKDYGWCCHLTREWAPCHVAWCHNDHDGCVGWCAAPPPDECPDCEGSHISTYCPPQGWCCCHDHDFLHPRIGEKCLPPHECTTIVSHARGCTNYTHEGGRWINHSIDTKTCSGWVGHTVTPCVTRHVDSPGKCGYNSKNNTLNVYQPHVNVRNASSFTPPADVLRKSNQEIPQIRQQHQREVANLQKQGVNVGFARTVNRSAGTTNIHGATSTAVGAAAIGPGKDRPATGNERGTLNATPNNRRGTTNPNLGTASTNPNQNNGRSTLNTTPNNRRGTANPNLGTASTNPNRNNGRSTLNATPNNRRGTANPNLGTATTNPNRNNGRSTLNTTPNNRHGTANPNMGTASTNPNRNNGRSTLNATPNNRHGSANPNLGTASTNPNRRRTTNGSPSGAPSGIHSGTNRGSANPGATSAGPNRRPTTTTPGGAPSGVNRGTPHNPGSPATAHPNAGRSAAPGGGGNPNAYGGGGARGGGPR